MNCLRGDRILVLDDGALKLEQDASELRSVRGKLLCADGHAWPTRGSHVRRPVDGQVRSPED